MKSSRSKRPRLPHDIVIAINKFERAVRAHEFLGASPPESHGEIRHELGRTRSVLYRKIDDCLKNYVNSTDTYYR